MNRRKIIIWILVLAVASLAGLTVLLRMRSWRSRSMTIRGAVVRRDSDTHKELPIADAVVTASDGSTSASTRSDSSGYFTLSYPAILWPGRTFDLSFQQPEYEPLHLKLPTGLRLTTRELYVAAMTPIPQKAPPQADGKLSVVSNIRIRYTENSQTELNVGSAVKTFEVVNIGNVPCNGQPPCSPDGNWKASGNSVTLDAGSGNEFRNVRASCIAGPCPFTSIDTSGFAHSGRTVSVSALDWSDTATFLMEAEVFHASNTSNVRESYPVVFGRTLNFSLPPTEEGVSFEAEIDGAAMVFPLGPDLFLSWATCTARSSTGAEKTTVYQCELKAGYRF